MSYYSAMFGSHNHTGSGVIMTLVCYVIFQDHVIKWLCNFMGVSPRL